MVPHQALKNNRGEPKTSNNNSVSVVYHCPVRPTCSFHIAGGMHLHNCVSLVQHVEVSGFDGAIVTRLTRLVTPLRSIEFNFSHSDSSDRWWDACIELLVLCQSRRDVSEKLAWVA